VGPRSLHVPPTFRRRRLWPWLVAGVLLLAVGLLELRWHRSWDVPFGPSTGTARVAGQVLGADGHPLPGVVVTMIATGIEARSAEDGRFELRIDPTDSPVRLEAHHSDLGFASADVRVPASGVVLRLDPRAGVEVRVLAGGRPVSGAEVTVVRHGSDGGIFHADRATDGSGSLRFVGLPGGPLEVEASLPESGSRAVARVEVREGAVSPVTLPLSTVGVAGSGR